MGFFQRIKELFSRQREVSLGISFGSGGAKGMAHLGVLKALEEEGFKFSYVTGTSIGAIVGALYAKGYTSADMVQIIEGVSRRDVSRGLNPFSDPSFAENFFSNYIDGDFDSLSLPFATWATNGETGEGVLLNRGKVAKALAASSAIPPYFRGVEVDGAKLYDGAFTNAIPCDVCKSMGAEFVIGVDLSAFETPDEEKGKLQKFLDTAISMVTPVKYKPDCKSRGIACADFMFRPNLKGFRAADITRESWNRMYELGYEEGKRGIPDLKAAIEEKRRTLKKKQKA